MLDNSTIDEIAGDYKTQNNLSDPDKPVLLYGKYNFRKSDGDIDVDAMVNELEKHLKRYFWKVD